MPVSPSNYTTLTAMITPALFMTANGSLIISTSNRMSRIVDRIRQLNELADSLSRGASNLDFPTERLEHIDLQLNRLIWRSDRIRLALTLLYLAMAMFVGTSFTMAIDALIGNFLTAAADHDGDAGSLVAALGQRAANARGPRRASRQRPGDCLLRGVETAARESVG